MVEDAASLISKSSQMFDPTSQGSYGFSCRSFPVLAAVLDWVPVLVGSGDVVVHLFFVGTQ